jgi:hypothetical protein
MVFLLVGHSAHHSDAAKGFVGPTVKLIGNTNLGAQTLHGLQRVYGIVLPLFARCKHPGFQFDARLRRLWASIPEYAGVILERYRFPAAQDVNLVAKGLSAPANEDPFHWCVDLSSSPQVISNISMRKLTAHFGYHFRLRGCDSLSSIPAN